MDDRIEATPVEMAKAFNEWMRRYIEEPERFERELTSVREFEKAEAEGQEPDYGTGCTAYLREILNEHRGASKGSIADVVTSPPEGPENSKQMIS